MNNQRALLSIALSCALSLCGTGASHAADTSGRDAAVSRITRSLLNSAFLIQGNLSAASTLEFVQRTNPGVSEAEWKTINAEAGEIMADGMSQPGNPMFTAYRKLLEPLSDTELAKLDTLLADPVYRKFSGMLTSPAGQQIILQGAIENAPYMPVALNLVLRKRGLKEVH